MGSGYAIYLLIRNSTAAEYSMAYLLRSIVRQTMVAPEEEP